MAIETDRQAGANQDLGRLGVVAIILLFGGALVFSFRPVGWPSASNMLTA